MATSATLLRKGTGVLGLQSKCVIIVIVITIVIIIINIICIFVIIISAMVFIVMIVIRGGVGHPAYRVDIILKAFRNIKSLAIF